MSAPSSQRTSVSKWLASAAAIALVVSAATSLSSCSETEPSSGPRLILQEAGRQPGKDSGVIVVAQTRGGSFLGLRTRGCTHTRADSGGFVAESCVSVAKEGTLVYFSAVTENGECVVHAELYEEVLGDATAGTASCPGRKVLEREVPISVDRTIVVKPTDADVVDASRDADAADVADGSSVSDANVEGG